MKLIHCADLHLDSPMESNLPQAKARERKLEIRATFSRLVRLADENGAEGILIAGDLFDGTRVTKSTETYVRDLIAAHPDLNFFYLAGNHDRGGSLRNGEDLPENLFLFGDGWTSHQMGDVIITGSERPNPDTLRLLPYRINILLLHGQVRSGRGASRDEAIHLSEYKNKDIDYIAMGHEHEYKAYRVDERATACYAGFLEGRGFDECGQKGYVLLDIRDRHVTRTFVPFATRTLHTVSCDVGDCRSQYEMETRLLKAVEEISAEDMVKVVLTGECPFDAQRDTAHLLGLLSERFYFAKLKDECRLLIRPEDYRNDISLKGEFIRRVMDSRMSDAEKERVIACGLRALAGEEIGL